MLELRDVWKSYKKGHKPRPILSGASLVLPPARRVALFGAEGAGKTTVLRLMSGLDMPDSGVVRRIGLSCWPLGTVSFVDNAGTLRQNANFLGHMYGLDAAEIAAIAVELSGVKIVKARRMSGYSGLERRRLAMGLTLALQFDWYFVDDALPAAAPEAVDLVDSVIADRFSRASVVWATRNVEMVADYCDAGIVLDRGALVFYDDIREASDAYLRVAASAKVRRK